MTQTFETWGPWISVNEATPRVGEYIQAKGTSIWGQEIFSEGVVVLGPFGLAIDTAIHQGYAHSWRRRYSIIFSTLLATVRNPAPLPETEDA